MNITSAAKYTRMNTGKHFLDSGGAYGRIYDRAYSNELVSIDNCGATINLTAWLAEYANFHSLHKQLYKWANNHPDKNWFDVGEGFMESCGYECKARDNVYNGENDFDQVFVYEVWIPEYSDNTDWMYAEDAVVLIYCHTGCDVRGGYASPMVLEFDCCDYVMPLDMQANLYSNDLSDDENEHLSVGYSGYPMGELEAMGYEYVENISDNEAIFKNEDNDQIVVFADYYGG